MSTAVRERPIVLSGDELRAVNEGRKTQVRRIIAPISNDDQGRTFLYREEIIWASLKKDELSPLDEDPPRSVFGARAIFDGDHAYTPIVVGKGPGGRGNYLRCPFGKPGDRLWMRSSFEVRYEAEFDETHWTAPGLWVTTRGRAGLRDGRHSPLHMPYWLSVEQWPVLEITGVLALRRQWEKSRGEDSWDRDPWVWVIEFRRILGE